MVRVAGTTTWVGGSNPTKLVICNTKDEKKLEDRGKRGRGESETKKHEYHRRDKRRTEWIKEV